MKARRSRQLTIGVFVLLTITLLIPTLAAAQTPPPLLPGQTPEVSRPLPYWLSYPVLAGAAGLMLLLGFAYWRLSSRFYGREEPPPPQRPRFAAMSVAPGQVAAPAERAAEAPKAPAGEPAAAEKPAAEKPAADAEKPAAEKPAAEKPAAEKPAAEKPAAEKPAADAEKPAAEKPAAAPVSSAAGGHVEPDQETFDRVLQEQIDKGVDRRVAEGRARAAAIKSARGKAGTG